MIFYLDYLLIIIVIAPICEWGIHYGLHLFNNSNHYIHHKQVRKNILDTKKNIRIERWPILVIAFCTYYHFYIGIFAFLKYYIIHTILHWKPSYLPSLANHHNVHHKYSKYNYCVTNIWPDKLFNTLYIKD
jgi:sterol desaturase/sphingolipid hydroxylase (fatty acid hydroxylase superfamily)